jgi:hypothetical protein
MKWVQSWPDFVQFLSELMLLAKWILGQYLQTTGTVH